MKIAFALMWTAAGCSACAGTPPPAGRSMAGNVAVCILNNEALDRTDLGQTCGASAADVDGVLAAHQAAETREGIVLRPSDCLLYTSRCV